MKRYLKNDLILKIFSVLAMLTFSFVFAISTAIAEENSSTTLPEASSEKLPEASSDVGGNYQEVDNRIKTMIEELQNVQKKLTDIKDYEKKEINKLSDRVDKNELHTATDKVSFGVEFNTKAESIHYNNMIFLSQDKQGQLHKTEGSINNDLIYTEKMRLNMKSKLNDQLDFTGRLSAYKVWGDSTGIKFNNGSMGDVYMDGNTVSLPSGDGIHLERGYFNYKFNVAEMPASISAGRRPSTEGSPLEDGNYGGEGGNPLATVINWQFDGVSFNLDLEDALKLPGNKLKLCYGLGFESGWGNSYSLTPQSDISDATMLGLIDVIYDDSATSLTALYAHAFNLTDGFTGLTMMPVSVDKNSTGGYTFTPNNGGYISRIEPKTNIGSYDTLSFLFKTNLSKIDSLEDDFKKDVDLFTGLSWSHTTPSQVSKIPFYEMLGMGLLSSNRELEARDGYSVYMGARVAMPYEGKLGLEYNWGSKYWLSMTGAEDSLIASKIAARGSVYEGYYIQPIINENFFAKLGLIYYDYAYTGSGNPLGEPVKIAGSAPSKLLSSTGFSPVIDQAFNIYLTFTMRF